MSDLELRLLIIGAVVVVVGVAALLARRYAAPYHPPIDISGLSLPPGIAVFTSTSCPTCKRALAAAKKTGSSLREVTYELEAASFEAAGVSGVPLTVIVGADGHIVGQFAGVPRVATLERALRRS